MAKVSVPGESPKWTLNSTDWLKIAKGAGLAFGAAALRIQIHHEQKKQKTNYGQQ